MNMIKPICCSKTEMTSLPTISKFNIMNIPKSNVLSTLGHSI